MSNSKSIHAVNFIASKFEIKTLLFCVTWCA